MRIKKMKNNLFNKKVEDFTNKIFKLFTSKNFHDMKLKSQYLIVGKHGISYNSFIDSKLQKSYFVRVLNHMYSLIICYYCGGYGHIVHAFQIRESKHVGV